MWAVAVVFAASLACAGAPIDRIEEPQGEEPEPDPEPKAEPKPSPKPKPKPKKGDAVRYEGSAHIPGSMSSFALDLDFAAKRCSYTEEHEEESVSLSGKCKVMEGSTNAGFTFGIMGNLVEGEKTTPKYKKTFSAVWYDTLSESERKQARKGLNKRSGGGDDRTDKDLAGALIVDNLAFQ